MLLRNLTIAKKAILVLLLPLLYQAILLGVLIRQQRTHSEAQELVVQTRDQLSALDDVHRNLLAMQGALRGFLITRVADFEAETDEYQKSARQAFERLRELTANAPAAQQQRVASLGSFMEERIGWHTQTRGLATAGRWEDALAQVRSLQGQKIMNEVQREARNFRQVAEASERERTKELKNSEQQQSWLLIGGLALNVIVGVGVVLYVSRNITRRIELLSENSRRFSKGEDLLPRAGGNDELAELDASFHDMAGGLLSSRDRERDFQVTLERRNGELERANRDLDHKNSENEMFVYSVSHDLRSPLVNLQGFSKELGLVRDDLRVLFDKDWDEKVRTRARKLVDRDISESIHYIQTAVMRLSAIIDALLRLSRAGRVEYQPEMVNVQKMAERIVTSLRGSLTEKGAEVKIHELPAVWGDPTALEQVFANLLANAVNYLDPKRPGLIEVGLCDVPPPAAGVRATYYVKDNGLGIAEAYLPKVFAMFQRLHSHAAQGEGVGLTLVRRMVERHGGIIWVESKAGEGSTFFVALPEKEDSPLVVAPKKESVRLSPSPQPSTP